MSDGKIPPGERYVQLNLKDMFGRRGSSNSNSNGGSGSRRESNDKESGGSSSSRGDTSEGRGGGPIRSHPSGRNNESGSSSGGAFSGFRNRDRERERDRNGRRDHDYDKNKYQGRGHRLGGDERPAERSPRNADAGPSDAPVLFQGTSSMLRAAGGKASGLGALNALNAPRVIKESPVISRSIYPGNTQGYLYNALDIKPLGAAYCPQYRLPAGDPEAGKIGCRIRVINCDTFACAEDMLSRHSFEQSQMEIARQQGNNEPDMHPPDNGIICLNMANAGTKGGGFKSGSVAQEEALMQRSTLWTTLPEHYYPMTETEAIYSPFVAIYKQLVQDAEGRLDYVNLARADAILASETPIKDANKATLPGPPLPEIAIVTIAAISGPKLKDGGADYRHDTDRALMELKIRQMLRIAGLNGHRRLVLGAFGCGVFANPKELVATIFLKVLREPEFQGGWWKEIVFGCYDPPHSSKPNCPIFHKVLDGQVV